MTDKFNSLFSRTVSVPGGHWLGFAVLALLCFGGPPLWAQTAQPSVARAGEPAAGACVISRGPNALWQLAQCCSKNLAGNSDCREYDAKDEYIILKDNAPTKPEAYLIIPTKRVSGIEDPQIFVLPFLDFWADAWKVSQKYPGQPASRTALAINSVHGRTQNQLHIHISCIKPAVSQILEAREKEIGFDPANPFTLRLPPHNNPYRVVRVTGLSGNNSPFQVIESMPGVKGAMAKQSIAVVRAPKDGDFYVLVTYYHGTDWGSAEELLDETCQPTEPAER